MSALSFAVVVGLQYLYPVVDSHWQNSNDEYPPNPLAEPSEPIVFPGEVNYAGSHRHREGRYPVFRNDFPPPLTPDDKPLTGSETCPGTCVHKSQCATLGGTPKHPCRGGFNFVCCQFSDSCSHSASDYVTHFKSPGYPEATSGNIICQFDLILKAGTCGVKIEFLEFNTTRPLDRGICHVDQLLIMNSIEGATFPRCGELTGYGTIVPVDARYKLPLTLLSILQSSSEVFKWNMKLTQVKCGAVPLVPSYPECGKSLLNEADVSLNQNLKNKEKGTSTELTTMPTVTVRDDENAIFDDSEQVYYKYTPKQNVDNAFYIAYLKQAYEAFTNTSNDANSTLCRNRANETTSEKLSQLRFSAEDSEDLARIIRGDEAYVSEFPWQISMQDKQGHICGGAIISPNLILTAAHCYMSISPLPIQEIKVIVGDHNFNSTSEAREERVVVNSVVFHSHFDPYYLENDIALIKLKTPLKFRQEVQPVCLPERGNSYVGRNAVVSGWGATSFPNGRSSNTLQKSENNRVIENSECKKKLKIEYLYETMLCAVAPNCSGTCFGDSGGPLTLKEQGRSVLVGLVSFGIGGCAFLPFWPDVYTRVTAFLDWLDYAAY